MILSAVTLLSFILPLAIGSCINLDIFFLLDVSPSLCSNLPKIASKLETVLNNNVLKKSRIAIATFGGYSNLIHGFETIAESSELARRISALSCVSSHRESSLEAIRTAIKGNFPQSSCLGECNVKWNTDAQKVMFVISDEDSDLPIIQDELSKQQMKSSLCEKFQTPTTAVLSESAFDSIRYSCADNANPFEPSLFPLYVHGTKANFVPISRLASAYELEVRQTAELIIESNVLVFFLMDPYNAGFQRESGQSKASDDVCLQQYGDPQLNVMIDDKQFDLNKTLSRLSSSKYQKSLQSIVLQRNQPFVAWELNEFFGSASKFSGVVQTYLTRCETIYVSSDSVSTSNTDQASVGTLPGTRDTGSSSSTGSNQGGVGGSSGSTGVGSPGSSSTRSTGNGSPGSSSTGSTGNGSPGSSIGSGKDRHITEISGNLRNSTNTNSTNTPNTNDPVNGYGSNSNGNNSRVYAITGGACGALVVLGIVAFMIHKKGGKKKVPTALALEPVATDSNARKRFSSMYFDPSSSSVDHLQVQDIRPLTFISEARTDYPTTADPMSPQSVIIEEEPLSPSLDIVETHHH